MNPEARILVVDDDAVVLRIVTNILERNGYVTDTCNSGEIAMEKVTQTNYDLVLLDVQMGDGLDGYQTCMRLQELAPGLPVILVTANTDDESVNKGFASGSSDYIKKPLSKLELLARVKKTITLRRTEQHNLLLITDLQKDLRTAASIQEALLPKWVHLDKDIIFSSHYEPSEVVGGDLFDRIKISDTRYVVYIGDISGHGVQAALLMTAVRSIIRIMVENERQELDLARLMTRLNEKLSNELFVNYIYMTLLLGVIDIEKQEFHYLAAGHPPLVVLDNATGETTIVESRGSLPLGWMPRLVYEADETAILPLQAGKTVLLFTDGIYECTNAQQEQFGINGLMNMLEKRETGECCVSLPYKLKHHLQQHGFRVSEDDFTLFAFQMMDSSVDTCRDCTAARNRHSMLSMNSALREVGERAQQCEALVRDWTGNQALASRVELIVDEFLNNIIQYGYRNSEDETIIIELGIHDGRLCLRFWDKGVEWMPEQMMYSRDDPFDFDTNLHDVSGKGVKMIMSMSNQFQRQRYDVLNETVVKVSL